MDGDKHRWQPITTDMVVRVDMFEDDVAYTFGLLRAAANESHAAGDSQRGKELRVVAREVARDFRDYGFDDIPARTEELRKIREDYLG